MASDRHRLDGHLGAELLASAIRHEDRPALWARGESFTYRELFERGRAIAAALSRARIGSHQRVAILSHRVATAYSAVIGALMAGCTYVPLNVRFPRVRNQAILDLSGATAVIVDVECASRLEEFIERLPDGVLAIAPESDAAASAENRWVCKPDLPRPQLEDRFDTQSLDHDAPAYILFTSGTTGVPKGVPISHRNWFAYKGAVETIIAFGPDDKVLQLTDLTFDLSVHDMFLTWLNGAALYSAPEDIAALVPRFIAKHDITACLMVPSTGAQAVRHGLLGHNVMPSLKVSIFAGEALPSEIARQWRDAAPGSAVYNFYGPTEGTIHVCGHRFNEDIDPALSIVPIGEPLPGLAASVRDEAGMEVAPGALGELYMAGPQFTAGYWLRPDLDQEKFVEADGLRWYRTGDLVRRDSRHGLLFAGRVDRQVKIRGYRVELQDVEAGLRRASGIDRVAALAWPTDKPGNASGIVAFVAGESLSAEPILKRCAELLPRYMIPSRLVFVTTLPLNANGKLDYKALEQQLRAES